MATIDLNLVRAFVAVHECGSFSAAASRLHVPRSTVSRAVAALEDALGVLLFQRTTRQVVTTPAGVALVDRVRPSLTGLENALAEVPEADEAPSGTLRITTTADLAATFLTELVARFVARYPQVRVEVNSDPAVVDLVGAGFDLALRVAVGPRRDSSLVMRKVGVAQFQLFAAPSYLARMGQPRSASELAGHECVRFRGTPWPGNERPSKRGLPPPSRVETDDMAFTRALIRAGCGIGGIPSFLAVDDLAAGAMVRVLPRWCHELGAVYLVHPARKHVPRRVSAFQELAVEALRRSPLAAVG